MTTSSDIRAIWKSEIFDSATIQAITTKCYAYDAIAAVVSTSEDASLYFQQQINFFTYLCSRRSETGSIRGTNTTASRFSHNVQVTYYLEKDIGEEDQNYNLTIDRMETLDSMVISELGKTWGSTVDYYEQIDLIEPSLINLDDREVWRVGYTYRGYKTV